MQVLSEEQSLVTLTAPYVPGFLGFREAPVLAQAVERLRARAPHLMPQAGTRPPLLTPALGPDACPLSQSSGVSSRSSSWMATGCFTTEVVSPCS